LAASRKTEIVRRIVIDMKDQRSKHLCWLWVLLAALTTTQVLAEDPVAQLLSRVATNVAEQQRSNPDFLANEDVTMQELENGKVVHEKHIVSEFHAVHSDSKSKSIEHRKVLSATEDGKPQNRSEYVLPLGVRGGFAEDAPGYFGQANAGCFDFESIRQDQLRGRSAIVLAMRRKKSSIADSTCSAAYKIDATAWIDTETYQILRLELGPRKDLDYSVPFSRSNGKYTYAPVIEYGEVQIADRSYWVPIEKRVDFVKENGKVTYKYVVRYSDFHKFVSTAKIVDVGDPGK
jgi:hypothetical protein